MTLTRRMAGRPPARDTGPNRSEGLHEGSTTRRINALALTESRGSLTGSLHEAKDETAPVFTMVTIDRDDYDSRRDSKSRDFRGLATGPPM